MTLTEQAYQELRAAIVAMRMKPGDRLDTESIGASLGFSRAPVVEALNMLRSEGLVVSRRRVGTFVAEIGREQIEEVFDAREMIEHHVAPAIVFNISDRQIGELADILAQAEMLLDAATNESFDYTSFMDLDSVFHTALVHLAGRKLYDKWFGELAAHMQRVRHIFDGNALRRAQESNAEHWQIIAAIQRRDVEALRTELLNHTSRSRIGAADMLDRKFGGA